MTDFRIEGKNLTFWVTVKPKSSRERLSTSSSGELCLAVHAPPVEGLANQACFRLLAESLGLPKNSIAIVAGRRSRRKLIRISGNACAGALSKLKALAGEGRSNR